MEKRKGPDLITRSITYLSCSGWLCLTAVLFLYHTIRPSNLGDRYFKTSSSVALAENAGVIILIFCLIGLAFSLGGLYANLMRNRRKRDFIHVNLIVLGVVSVTGMIMYLVN